MILVDWHTSPDEVLHRWSGERLAALLMARSRRIERENEAIEKAAAGGGRAKEPRRVSAEQMFNDIADSGFGQPIRKVKVN